jgi:hypothetical protein
LVRWPLIGLLILARSIDDECEAVGGMRPDMGSHTKLCKYKFRLRLSLSSLLRQRVWHISTKIQHLTRGLALPDSVIFENRHAGARQGGRYRDALTNLVFTGPLI